MALEWDPITFVNLVLCIIIVVLGYLGYNRTKNRLPLYVGGAFGLFGVSHTAVLLGYKNLLTYPLIGIRTLAYLLVIYALYRFWKESMLSLEARQAWIDFYREESKKD